MRDGIMKGNGTSRKMKALLPATYEAFKQAVADGTQTLDVVFNPDGWDIQPTFLNKQNLLRDKTAAVYNGNADSTPDSILNSVFSVGDFKESLRVDLGENWGLCNGQLYDTDECPDLRALLVSKLNIEGPLQTAPGLKRYRIVGNKSFAAGPVNGVLYYSNSIDSLPQLSNTITPEATGLSSVADIFYANGYYFVANNSSEIHDIVIAYSSDLKNWTKFTVTITDITSVQSVNSIIGLVYFGGKYFVSFTYRTANGLWWGSAVIDNLQSTSVAMLKNAGIIYSKCAVSKDGSVLCLSGQTSYSTYRYVYDTSYKIIQQGSMSGTGGNISTSLLPVESDVYILCSLDVKAMYVYLATQSDPNKPTYTVSFKTSTKEAQVSSCYSPTGYYALQGDQLVDFTSTPVVLDYILEEPSDYTGVISTYFDPDSKEIVYNVHKGTTDTVVYNLANTLPNIPLDYGYMHIRKK